MTVEKRLNELIIGIAPSVRECDFNENTNLIADFHFDSLSFMQLILEVENEFDFEISDENFVAAKLSQYSELLKMCNTYNSRN